MPDNEASNGRITLAVIKVQLDQALALLQELKANAAKDHDGLIKLEEQMQDFITLKRAIWLYGVGLILSLAMALYSVTQHTSGVGLP